MSVTVTSVFGGNFTSISGMGVNAGVREGSGAGVVGPEDCFLGLGAWHPKLKKKGIAKTVLTKTFVTKKVLNNSLKSHLIGLFSAGTL
jgi:hypothetical protein